jgi:DNA-binding transcriptional regulator YiaG
MSATVSRLSISLLVASGPGGPAGRARVRERLRAVGAAEATQVTGAEFRAALERVRWSQAEFVRRTGVSTMGVNYWATEKRPVPPWVPAFLDLVEQLRAVALSAGVCKE